MPQPVGVEPSKKTVLLIAYVRPLGWNWLVQYAWMLFT